MKKKEKKKKIQVVKQIARANYWQPEEVDRVIGKMSARKDKQNTTVHSVEVLKSRTISGKTY